MPDRDSPRDEADPQRPKRGARKGPRDPSRVAEHEAATSLPHGTESSYGAAARPAASRSQFRGTVVERAIVVIAPADDPVLGPAAARALLRLLRGAFDERQTGGVDG